MEKAHTVSAGECESIHFSSHPLLYVVVGPFVHLHVGVSLNYLAVTHPCFFFSFFFFYRSYKLNLGVTLAMVLETCSSSIGVFSSAFRHILLVYGFPFTLSRAFKTSYLVKH